MKPMTQSPDISARPSPKTVVKVGTVSINTQHDLLAFTGLLILSVIVVLITGIGNMSGI